jgi:hypothetical protein
MAAESGALGWATFGFHQSEIVAKEDFMTIWRQPGIIAVRLRGEVDDRASHTWRAAVTAEVQLRGLPRFVAFDMYDCDPQSSMASRFQVASYVRDLMRRSEWAAILMPRAVGASVVVRLVMSIAGIPNVSVAPTKPAYWDLLEAMRKGERPRT